jgi:ribokinase
MGKVLVLGSINTDLVVRVPRLPRPGETVLGGEFAVYGGGKGANQAIAAARAGAPVVMVGCLGDDAYGDERLADLGREGVDTSGVRRLAGSASGVALIGVDAAGQNSIMVASGANALAGVEMATALPLAAGDVLLTQLELPLPVVAAGLATARRAGTLVLLNAAPMHPTAADLLPDLDLLVVNEVEAADLLGESVAVTETATLARLAKRGPRRIVVTLGKEGAVVWEDGQMARVPALPVEPVDTTGAGDTFCGVLAAGLAAGDDLAAAVRRAVVAGGLAVTRAGAQSSLPRRAEIDAVLATYEAGR